jgi:hypothetical protein
VITAKRLARLLALRHGPRATEKVEERIHRYAVWYRTGRSERAALRFIYLMTVLHNLQRISPEPLVS